MSEIVEVPAADLEDIVNVVRDLQQVALAGGFPFADRLMTTLRAHPVAALWVGFWLGRNHQRLDCGDRARVWDGDEWMTVSILAPHTFGATVEDEDEASWRPWYEVHHLDRLHTEPTFDVGNLAAIADHMNYPRDAAWSDGLHMVEPLFLSPRLTVVRGVRT